MKSLMLRVIAALALVLAAPALAQDTLKLAIGQRGNWDTSVAEVGTRLGIFKKHNIQRQTQMEPAQSGPAPASGGGGQAETVAI